MTSDSPIDFSYRLLHLPKHALHILNDVVDNSDGSMVPTLRQSVGRWFVQLASHAWEVFLCAYARSGTWSKPEPRRLQGYSEDLDADVKLQIMISAEHFQ